MSLFYKKSLRDTLEDFINYSPLSIFLALEFETFYFSKN